jgi:hypothetical protein
MLGNVFVYFICLYPFFTLFSLINVTHHLAILGNKYGYRPFPARIEADEFDKLIAHLKGLSHPDVYD